MGDNRNFRDDRIDVKFNNSEFVETLKKWKLFCKSIDGGQTERLQKLIKEDVKKIKTEVIDKLGKI